MDLAKIGYKSYLEEGVGKLPSLQAPVRQEDSRVSLKEGWALRVVRKAYRFSEKQKSYLLSKFRIGQTTGHKLDAEVVAREMRRARVPFKLVCNLARADDFSDPFFLTSRW